MFFLPILRRIESVHSDRHVYDFQGQQGYHPLHCQRILNKVLLIRVTPCLKLPSHKCIPQSDGQSRKRQSCTMTTHEQSSLGKSSQGHSESFILGRSVIEKLSLFVYSRDLVQEICYWYSESVKQYEAVVHSIQAEFGSTVSNCNPGQNLMSMLVSQRYHDRMNSMTLPLDIDLGPYDTHIGCFSCSSNPKLHGILGGTMDDQFAAGVVVVSLGEQTLDVRSMQKFSQCKTPKILILVGPFVELPVKWCCSQSFQGLEVK